MDLMKKVLIKKRICTRVHSKVASGKMRVGLAAGRGTPSKVFTRTRWGDAYPYQVGSSALWAGKTNPKVGLDFWDPKYFSQKIFLEKYFLSFIFSLAPPPFFSTRYLIKCYIIVYLVRRSVSDSGGRV